MKKEGWKGERDKEKDRGRRKFLYKLLFIIPQS